MSSFKLLAISYHAPNAPDLFAQSLQQTGFAILKDHPIEQTQIAELYRVWQAYFASPARFADAVQDGEAHGYYGFKSENAKGRKQKDLKEFFHVYAAHAVPATVEIETRRFFQEMLNIGRELLGWLDLVSPEAVRQRFSEPLTQMIEHSDKNLLRILHYPPLAAHLERGEVRAAAHEDINLLTLLVTGSEPGLQARDQAGVWHDVPCDPGYITINAGDMLARASRAYYPSTTHRVINPPQQANVSRYSIPLFVHPRPDVQLDADQTAAQYLDQRLREIGLMGTSKN